jgi:hypothetical protein
MEHWEKECILCKDYCDIGCLLCKRIVGCMNNYYHNRKCEVCDEKLCGSFTPGKLVIWWSKKTETSRCVCMDCLFEGALYVHGLMNFNNNKKIDF